MLHKTESNKHHQVLPAEVPRKHTYGPQSDNRFEQPHRMFSRPYRMLHRPNRSILFRALKIPYAEKLVGTAKNSTQSRGHDELTSDSSVQNCFRKVTSLVSIVSTSLEPYAHAPTVRLVARDLTTAVALMPSWPKTVVRLSACWEKNRPLSLLHTEERPPVPSCLDFRGILARRLAGWSNRNTRAIEPTERR